MWSPKNDRHCAQWRGNLRFFFLSMTAQILRRSCTRPVSGVTTYFSVPRPSAPGLHVLLKNLSMKHFSSHFIKVFATFITKRQLFSSPVLEKMRHCSTWTLKTERKSFFSFLWRPEMIFHFHSSLNLGFCIRKKKNHRADQEFIQSESGFNGVCFCYDHKTPRVSFTQCVLSVQRPKINRNFVPVQQT